MQAIPPTRHASSLGAPLNEGVLRFGATQEGRESLRRERSAEVEKEEGMGPQDRSLISDVEISQGTGGEGKDKATSSSSASGEGQVQGHSSTRRRGTDDGTPQPGARSPAEDGSQNQREAALAQHAAEQHGKREQGRQEGDRSLRSTRDMMGRVEGARGGGEAHESPGGGEAHSAPSSSRGGHAGGSASAGSPRGGAGGAGSASHGGKGSGAVHRGGGGSHVRASSGQAPRVGGDVIAAVVGSGLTSVEDVAPGSAQADDEKDDEAQQADSSQQATQARLSDQGIKTQKSSGLGSGLNFGGDGERGRHFDESPGSGRGFQNPNQRPGQGTGGETSHDEERGPANEHAAGGSGGDDRQPPPREATGAGEGAPVDERPSEEPGGERAGSTVPSPVDVKAEPVAERQEESEHDGLRHEVLAGAVTEAPPPVEEAPSPLPVASSAAPTPPSPDGLGSAASGSLGIDWMADTEYFFFDDARHTAEEAPPAPT